jgi:hypothetical protein
MHPLRNPANFTLAALTAILTSGTTVTAIVVGSNMARIEIVCPNCHQVNRRGTDFVGRLLDPRQPKLCTLCGTNLRTRKRDAGGLVMGVMGWTATYFLNAFAYAAVSMMFSMGILLAWQDFFLSHPDAGQILWPITLITGALVGIWEAERARRKGELHTNAKKAKGSKR